MKKWLSSKLWILISSFSLQVLGWLLLGLGMGGWLLMKFLGWLSD